MKIREEANAGFHKLRQGNAPDEIKREEEKQTHRQARLQTIRQIFLNWDRIELFQGHLIIVNIKSSVSLQMKESSYALEDLLESLQPSEHAASHLQIRKQKKRQEVARRISKDADREDHKYDYS